MKRKKATVKDIAEMANVSSATVSRALNGSEKVKPATLKLIYDIAKDVGYGYMISPLSLTQDSDSGQQNNETEGAPELRNVSVPPSGSTILIHITDMSNPFYAEVLHGIETSLYNNGNFDFLIYSKKITQYNIDSFLKLVNDLKVIGLVTVNLTDTALLKEISKKIPVVQCGEFTENPFASSVGINDYVATQQAIEYFLSLHRTRIGMVNGPLTYKYARDRLAAFQAITKDAGLDIPPNWIIQLPQLNHDMAFSSIIQLLNTADAPDCFFCVSDILAAAAVRAVQYCNLKIPEDVMIIGFDNIIFSQLTTPSITTVSQPQFQLGFLSGELLLEKIMNPMSETKHVMLNTELIIRESTSYNT